MSFKNIYRGKKVLVTGHTGFKGSWLCVWLLSLGAEIVGISCDIPTNPSLFEVLDLEKKIKHYMFDLLELEKMKKVFIDEQPDFVFHLAAQAIVSESFKHPIRTLSTNIMGTAHTLEAILGLEKKVVAVMISSDKCYENIEWCWGYKETDPLGGKDIYSASKAGAECVIHSYFETYIKSRKNIRIASARAGNVIGGGDWAMDRIVADSVRAWSNNQAVEIRSPSSMRPWQHVLEPLSGYLNLGMELWNSDRLNGEAFNFGPRAEQNRSVLDLLQDMAGSWGFSVATESYNVIENRPFKEAGLLKLNCDKSLFYLKWQACLNYQQTVEIAISWYKTFYQKQDQGIYNFTLNQINQYCEIAKAQNLTWMKND
jgi:CDP-glucose 4,6-dehydratase